MSERIEEFLARYDACKFRGGTTPAAWLDEAASLLRAVADGSASMTRELFDTRLTVLIAEALYAGLPHNDLAVEFEHLAAALRE